MDRAEFRQWAMIHALQGMLASGDFKLHDPNLYPLIARRAVQFADALLEANTIDEVPKSETP